EGVAEEAFEVPADMQGTLLGDISVDWDALRAVNPDVVGWVYMPGTVINYPILQADDNVTYLTRDFHGNEGGSWLPTYGAIILTAENASDFSDDNSVLQGHHLQNGVMFAFIADELKDQEPFNQHRDVYVLTPQGNYHLNSFSIVLSEPYEPIVETNFATVADMTAYVEDKMKRNLVSPDPEAPAASEITQLFTLSTCDEYSSGAHYVLFCYVVDYVAFDDVSGGEGVLVDPNTESVIDDAVNEQ
ncbi:MAG: class B sortase, partial [Eggerthellaceae bacterium]|nr:class B sortase [Eggerthellaceae bacterium]